jgi:hypothetical protein
MRREEKIVQEKRTIEAITKNLMGLGGKLGIIAKYLGDKIIRQGSSLYDVSYMDDPYDLPDDGGIKDSEDGVNCEEGLVFDGLRFGMHIEIHVFSAENKIVVYYRGFEVYREESGDLLGYAPFPEWEKLIDSLYKKARKREEESKQNVIEKMENEIKKSKKSFFEKLGMRWGI